MVLGWGKTAGTKSSQKHKSGEYLYQKLGGRWFWEWQANKNSEDAIDVCRVKVRLVAARAIRPSKIITKQGSQHVVCIIVCR
jgi:hypothetical protein